MTSRTENERRIWGIWRKLESWDLTPDEKGWLSLAHRSLGQVSPEMRGRWKSHVEKPLNSKVMKSFVPELRSHYVFFEFRYSYVLCYIYIWTLYVHFTHIRIWVWYTYIQRGFGIKWPSRVDRWCNGYRRRKWTRRLEFKSWTRLIAFH